MCEQCLQKKYKVITSKKGIYYLVILLVFAIYIFSISLLLPENFRNIPTIVFSPIVLFLLFMKNEVEVNNRPTVNKLLLINSSFFIMCAISVIYSSNYSYGIDLTLRLLPTLVVPLCFYLVVHKTKVSLKNFEKHIMLLFYISTIIFFVGILIYNFFDGRFNKNYFIHISERINSKYWKYSIHPIYASLFICISLIFSIRINKYINTKGLKNLFYISNLFLLLMLFMMMRKGAIILMLIILLAYFIRKGNIKKIFLFIALVSILFIISMTIAPVRNRFLELFTFFIDGTNTAGSTSIRLKIYECSLKSVMENPVLGYGIGDVLNVLTECYSDFPNIFKGTKYNTHNQYFGALMSSGILGLVSLLTILAYNFKLAYKSKNIIYLFIVILFFGNMIFENILDRQNGIILFSFFINYFAFSSIQKSKC